MMAVAVAMAVAMAMAMAVAMAVAMAMAMAVAMAMVVAMAVAVAMVVVNFKECKNDLDDTRIYQRGVVHALPTFGSAIRLLSLPAG
jgi:hypothetical protein